MRSAALRKALRPLTRLTSTPTVSAPFLPIRATLPRPSLTSSAATFTSTSITQKKNKGSPPKSSKAKLRITEDDEAGAADDEGAGEAVIADVVEKARGKMEKAVHWAKAVIFEDVERIRGRVTPALLDSVRVEIPGTKDQCHLNTLASITMKGNALFVEVWDSDSTKHVESAIHRANLPGMSPQKTGANTLKIPVARPTAEQRTEILRQLASTVEAAKSQIRMARTEGFKHLGGRKSNGTDDIQKIVDASSKELDEQMALAKKEFEKA
ncbi:ribosome recycling factor [Kwoniella heveanensis BCC8398]|uniref:Ribosome recycling factor n=1 Tax=Kwoniella heveanensis BCC8398 TaxID=1296120 RepID=A0A1B9GZK3_9TREE|nr:ribosome recycling factor [Kwoniella heveanensis BCC8398]